MEPDRGQGQEKRGSTQRQKPLEAGPPHLTSARASRETLVCMAGLASSCPHACKILDSSSGLYGVATR